MDCPNCGRRLPDTLVCKHCGLTVPPRPPLWRRLLDRLKPPPESASVDPTADSARPDEEPEGIEMPAAARTATMSVSRASNTRQEGVPLKNLPEDAVEALRRAAASGGAVYYEQVVSDDGSGLVVSEQQMPPDPELEAAADEMMNADAGGTDEQIVADITGERQVYGSADEMPPEVREKLSHFADKPLTADPSED